MRSERGNLHDRVEIRTPEYDPGVDGSGTQGHEDFLTGVDAYAGGSDDVLEGTLIYHYGDSSRSSKISGILAQQPTAS